MNRADLYGRARRDGIKMDKLDLPDALDVIYSYVLDDSAIRGSRILNLLDAVEHPKKVRGE